MAQVKAQEQSQTKVSPLADLVVEDTKEQPEPQRGRRGSRFAKSPAVAWLKDSYERDISKTFEVPNDRLEDTVKEIRGAATSLKLGVSIARLPSQKKDHTRITFRAKDKRKYQTD